MKVRRFQPGDVEPIARLNERLRAGRINDVVFPEGAEQHRTGPVRERLFVAEDDGEIRGGVWLKEQPFRIRGQDVPCGWLKYPVAESLIDSRYSGVPASLIVQCLREQPRLFALGLGGHDTPLARMLKALRWTGVTVPMFVRVVRPARCLRQLAPARRTAVRRLAADVIAFSGAATLATGAFNMWTRARHGSVHGYVADVVSEYGSWADELWRECRDQYELLGLRSADTVESLLPSSADIRRLRVRAAGRDAGWATVLCHDFSRGAADRTFGTLTVGMIADAFARPERAKGVVAAAYGILRAMGADVVISNQLHPAWTNALRASGFLETASNFAFYMSPTAVKPPVDLARCHVNRGDCDGPVWYDRS